VNTNTNINRHSSVLTVLAWGVLWGIFEATVGYLLHLLPFSTSWLVMFPAACFFMAAVYERTGSSLSVLFTGLLCAFIKLLNLLLPGRVDRVINPAVSILFEAMAMAAAAALLRRLPVEKKKGILAKAFLCLGVNTLWRLLFGLYLLLLVPGWMREVSVISSMEKALHFFVTQNLLSSALLLLGYQFKSLLLKPVQTAEKKLATAAASLSPRALPAIKIGAVALMLSLHAALELLL